MQFPEIRLQKGIGIYFSILILLLPAPWLVAGCVAAGVHELCHVAALRILRYPVNQIRFCMSGARIITGPLSPFHELVCSLAGPLGGMMLIPLLQVWPMVCLFVVLQSLYNLIPLYPMDGGRAMRSIFTLLGLGDRMFAGWEILVSAFILALGIWSAFRFELGFPAVVISLFAVLPALSEK